MSCQFAFGFQILTNKKLSLQKGGPGYYLTNRKGAELDLAPDNK